MIFPTRVARGFQVGPVQTHVFSAAALGANNTAYGTGGIKTDSILIAGLLRLTVFYLITGAGTTTVRAIPMDDVDAAELPFKLTLGTALPAAAGMLPITLDFVCTSLKIEVVSSSNNAITALMFGRTA